MTRRQAISTPRPLRWHHYHEARIAAAASPRRRLSVIVGYLLSLYRRVPSEVADRVVEEVCTHLLQVIAELRAHEEVSR